VRVIIFFSDEGLSPCIQIQDFSTGFVGGTVLVLSVQCINALLGFAQLSWPLQLISSSVDLTTKMKAYGQLFLLAAQGILTAAGIAFVEELLFRSWLLEEIATDLGYQSAILLSALAFSLSQRYGCITVITSPPPQNKTTLQVGQPKTLTPVDMKSHQPEPS